LAAIVLAAVPVGALAPEGAPGAPVATKVVRYLSSAVRVPRSWPVYDLDRSPAVCVRFDRHALYLGTPSPQQRCPAHAVGRTEAILLEPLANGLRYGALQLGGAPSGQLTLARRRVLATATWDTDPGVVKRALGLRSLADRSPSAAPPRRFFKATAHPAQVGGGVYTGLGFDACAAPSTASMSAWGASSYRALGVYIGGENRACSQPNLTASWVSAETAAGWHLIPTYVGLQAPTNSCGCQPMSANQAQSQGTADATAAVTDAQAVGIGAGSPIYFDMEAYPRGGTNTSAVLAFLSAWTVQLHAQGYQSGVYSSAGSGISDLVAQVGSGYVEPDDIWIADWNGQQTSSDSYVPGGEWSNHQRLHQYRGAHNETHGGVKINIDSDYLDGATAGEGATVTSPVNTTAPSINGVARVGQRLSAAPGGWLGATPISYSYQWQLCSPGCRSVAGAKASTFTPGTSAIGAHVRVLVTASNSIGSAQVPASQVGPVMPAGYWLFTTYGNVYASSQTRWFGSPALRRLRTPTAVGMAPSPDGAGYWVASSSGQVWAFGDASRLGWLRRAHPVIGIVASPSGGYWLYTASGNIYASSRARWLGSPSEAHLRSPTIVGMASSPDGGGYWLVGSAGRVWAFGDAAKPARVHPAHMIAGIVADPAGGYWLFTSYGNVYASAGARWFGSPSEAGLPTIVGMASSPDGGGYWLVDASGQVFAFGDAGRFARLAHSHPLAGIAAG
jgi:hypothetical protein